MRYCSHCGKQLEPDVMVCPYCGTKIESMIVKEPVPDKMGSEEKACPYCGGKIPSFAVACPYCGKTLNTADKKKKWILLVVLAIAICIIGGAIVVRKVHLAKMESTYSEAQLAMDDFDYEQAQELLNSIPEYKDAQELLKQAEDGEFMSMCAQYIFNFIQDGSFYNPSAVRLLQGTYLSAEDDEFSEILQADGVLYITIQGTNKLGGTLSKDYVIFIGGDFDGMALENDAEEIRADSQDNPSSKPIDVALVNRMLQKYWADMGIE